MTVGPVTIINVPNNIEVLKSHPSITIVMNVPPIKVTNAPLIIKPRIALLSRLYAPTLRQSATW